MPAHKHKHRHTDSQLGFISKMAVLLHAKVTTLQLISKNGHNLGSDYHVLMKLSRFLNYG